MLELKNPSSGRKRKRRRKSVLPPPLNFVVSHVVDGREGLARKRNEIIFAQSRDEIFRAMYQGCRGGGGCDSRVCLVNPFFVGGSARKGSHL